MSEKTVTVELTEHQIAHIRSFTKHPSVCGECKDVDGIFKTAEWQFSTDRERVEKVEAINMAHPYVHVVPPGKGTLENLNTAGWDLVKR